MSTKTCTRTSTIENTKRRQRGFSAIEVMVSIAVITVVAGVVIPQVFHEFQKAELAKCKAELDLMKAVAYSLGDGRYIPTPEQFWGEGFGDAEDGEYYYIVDDQDANKGHGNDLDGCDEDNPGNSPRCPGMDIKFVVFCAHDHGELAKYQYATDDLPPTTVLPGEDDPFNFKAQKDQGQGNDPKPEGKEPKKPKKTK
jgi:prepilin-type N-terminal cleavage/methylation domain-containing protein